MAEEGGPPRDATPDTMTAGEKAAFDLQDVIDQFYPDGELALRRRALLPPWIKFFSYLYILISFGLPVATAVALVRGTGFRITFYGIQYSADHIDALAALLLLGLMGAGTAGFGLLWGKSWGIDAGLIVGGVGLTLSLWSIFLYDGFHLPLEPFLIVPFVIALWKRRAEWDPDAGD
jgi:hypothetical protein